MEFRKYNDVMILENHSQLRKLARLLRNQEEPLMLGMRSEIDKIEYLKKMNDAHDNMVNLLSEAEALAQSQAHPAKAEVSKEIEKYIIYAANWTMQCIRNCRKRVDCIAKIKAHFGSMVKELEELDGDNKDEVEDLLSLVKMHTHRMWAYANTSRSAIARAQSRAFSQGLILEGITMEELLNRTKNSLGFKPDFEDLEEHRKLEVYETLINESGRATLPTMYKRKFRKAGHGDLLDIHGIAVLAVQAGVLLDDIFTAENDIESALREASVLLADVVDFPVKSVVNAKKVPKISLKKKKKVSNITAMLTASVARFVAVFNAIFGSGGSRVPPDMEKLKFHAGEMPDGMPIAFQLSHLGLVLGD